jgi:hypothetical protein
MSRTVAVVWHASLSILAAAGYFFFVLPRWWELSGEWPTTLGLIMRIVTGVVVALAALPVVFTWLRTRRPEYGTPELALRLRICAIALHVLAGVLIVGTAISEIWLKLDDVGQWLFGVYGAAAAIFLLAVFSFYLAFVAELPPPPPRPLKKKRERKSRRQRRKEAAEAAEEETTEDTDEAAESEEAESDADEDAASQDEEATVTVEKSDDEAEAADAAEASDTDADASDAAEADETPAAEDTLAAEPARGGIRNRRPSGKLRRPRRFRKSDGNVAVED